MSYLQQKDSTWQTRRPSSPFNRYTRSHRRQLFLVFALLCTLVYWTACVGLNTSGNLFTPPLPATPNFFAGGSEDRLVTVQPHKTASDAITEDHDRVKPQFVENLNTVKSEVTEHDPIAEKTENRPASVQVIKGSSVHDIGDIEEQQSSAEDALELQPVVVDGGRLTDMSKTQAIDRHESSGSSAFDQDTSFKGGLHVGGAAVEEAGIGSQLTKPVTAGSHYVFPDTSNFERLNRLADELPDFVHIPLHMAVEDEVLENWEEDWFAHANFDATQHGKVAEPKIDFVYTCKSRFTTRSEKHELTIQGVNGSDTRFAHTMRPYELNSSLNDDAGEWIASHGVNRYRDWDELRYSIRSVEKHASSFSNNVQILVNAVEGPDGEMTKQRPTWLKSDSVIGDKLQVLSQEDFFGEEEAQCLPTFNSLTIENQIHNTPSDTDRVSFGLGKTLQN
jgi:hypothetical protein